MTKAELVDKIAKEADITRAQADKAANSFLDGIAGALKVGDKVTFVGFGSFDVKERKARIGRNPQTGAEIKISARKVVLFTVGKALKEAVQEPATKEKSKK